MSLNPVRVSVVLCTHNPRPDLIAWTLNSIEQQRLAKDEFELVIVDNRSEPPLESRTLERSGVRMRLVREERPGLTQARIAGIESTSAPLLVFVDDDNHLDPDYLERAIEIADAHPWIGCFGGKARAVLEGPIEEWQHSLLGHLGVRDYGPRPITSMNRRWGRWEPIGAGMVCRREVAEYFARVVRALPLAARLGRSRGAMMSGEDSLLAQSAYCLNYACSYQPALGLSHWMKAGRLAPKALARTLAGHGRSHVVLQALKGDPVPRPALAGMVRKLWKRYWHLVKRHGRRAGAIYWFWDVGFYMEARR